MLEAPRIFYATKAKRVVDFVGMRCVAPTGQ
jgi:hypothetical protein